MYVCGGLTKDKGKCIQLSRGRFTRSIAQFCCNCRFFFPTSNHWATVANHATAASFAFVSFLFVFLSFNKKKQLQTESAVSHVLLALPVLLNNRLLWAKLSREVAIYLFIYLFLYLLRIPWECMCWQLEPCHAACAR